MVNDFPAAHLSYLKQGDQDHLGRAQITQEYLWTEALSFFLRKIFYWPINPFVAAGKNPYPYQRFCRSLSIFLQRKATERIKQRDLIA